VIIAWEDHRIPAIGGTIYCQKLSLDGNTQWQHNGRPVSSLNGFQARVQLEVDSNGNTVACWMDARTNPVWDIYSQKFDGSGIILWEVEGRKVSIANSYKSWKNIIITNNEDYIVTWGDERNTDPDIFAQSLNALVTSVNNSTTNTPELFVLSQNFPNPFNPSTTIKFSLPPSGYAALKIYNALGEEVAVLLNKELQTGTYEVEWNATDFPSGIYFYQLKTEELVESKKMVLLK
jgi:hypothetical protein